MKKIVSVVFVVILLLSMSTTAFAENRTDSLDRVQRNLFDFEPGAVQVTGAINRISMQRGSASSGDIFLPASTDRPTAFWNLSHYNFYTAIMDIVGIQWLYTNYYFKPSSKGKIRVDYTVYADTHRPTQMKIGCYDHTSKKFVAFWTTAGAGGEGTSNIIDFYNLNKSHYYSIAFVALFDGFTHDTLHGKAYISHP